MSKWIAVSKVGKYQQGNITPEILQELVDSYNKDFQAAPFISQHRKFDKEGVLENNERALAWAEQVSTDGNLLYVLVSEDHDLKWYYDGISFKYASIEIEVVQLNGEERLYLAAIAVTNFPAAKIPTIEFNREKIGSRLIAAYNKIEIKDNKTELVMNKEQLTQLCKIFDLPENSDAKTVIAKLTEMKDKFAEKEDLKKYTDKFEKVISVMSEPGTGSDSTNLPTGSKVEDQLTQLTSTVNSLVEQLSKTAKSNLETEIDNAIKAEKFVPAQKDFLLGKYEGDVEGFKTFAAASPKIQLNSTLTVPKNEGGKPITYNDLLTDTKLYEDFKNNKPELFEKLRAEWQANPNVGKEESE